MNEVYLKGYASVVETRTSISNYLGFLNQARRHQSLERQTPDPVYYQFADQRMAA